MIFCRFLKKCKQGAKFILVGKSETDNNLSRKPESAVNRQAIHVKEVWYSNNYTDFGIERILRLSLVLVQFIFPGLYIRYLAGKKNVLCRKISNEIYVLIKIFIYACFLCCSPIKRLVFICIYLIMDTLCYLLGLIFLEPEYKSPTSSNKRNLILVILNYIEITLGFANIYYHYYHDSIENMKNSIDALYFSFVTTTTLGYGDMHPLCSSSKVMCAIHSFMSFLFVVFILSVFLSNFNKGMSDKWNKNSNKTSSNEQ